MKHLVPLLLIGLLSACSSSQITTVDPQPITVCGEERWSVKNLLDPDTSKIDFVHYRMTTLLQLTGTPATKVGMTTSRLDDETQVVAVPCWITAIKREDDGDVHLLLTDSMGRAMIAEVPDPDKCPDVAKSGHADQYRAALTWVRTNLGNPTTSFKYFDKPATIKGVLFQDFSHGQKSEAPNSMEIHPVLLIQ